MDPCVSVVVVMAASLPFQFIDRSSDACKYVVFSHDAFKRGSSYFELAVQQAGPTVILVYDRHGTFVAACFIEKRTNLTDWADHKIRVPDMPARMPSMAEASTWQFVANGADVTFARKVTS